MCILNKCVCGFMWLFLFACVCTSTITCLYLLPHHSVFACFQNELVFTDIIRLSVNGAFTEGPGGAQQPSIGKISITLHACMYIRIHVFHFKSAVNCDKYVVLILSDIRSGTHTASGWCCNSICAWRFSSTACGTSFDFHKQIDYLFLVGTEEGKIHKVCF